MGWRRRSADVLRNAPEDVSYPPAPPRQVEPDPLAWFDGKYNGVLEAYIRRWSAFFTLVSGHAQAAGEFRLLCGGVREGYQATDHCGGGRRTERDSDGDEA